MKKTPIVFCFDDTLVVPAGVCISSLLKNAKKTTFYHIFILYSKKRLSEESIQKIKNLKTLFQNFELSFVECSEYFKGKALYEVRKITGEAYYRLLIPDLIKDYDKVIYSDVDVIFTGDYSHLMDLDMENTWLGVVPVPNFILEKEPIFRYYLKNIVRISPDNYFNSGFLLYNLKEKHPLEQMKKLLNKKYLYQDQDILSINYAGKLKKLPMKYIFICYAYKHNILEDSKNMIYHYAGPKPWNTFVRFGDLWWEHYRKSIFYETEYYENFYENAFLINKSRLKKILKKFAFFHSLLHLKNIFKVIIKYKYRGLKLKK